MGLSNLNQGKEGCYIMPLFKEDKHTISIYKETKFIIDQYHAALVVAGLVTTTKRS